MKATNRYRVMRCGNALRRYDTDFDITSCLVDFLADARHWCDRYGQDFADLDRVAHEHYSAEVIDARRG